MRDPSITSPGCPETDWRDLKQKEAKPPLLSRLFDFFFFWIKLNTTDKGPNLLHESTHPQGKANSLWVIGRSNVLLVLDFRLPLQIICS